ncbi:Type-1B angiotensin II receptor [Holothuria leucospilota]|uniref:Type-1B angiotensin II receptor n=1 Tax=Holothuria leucospilota TaxID=206669 RepID=A0A9Q1BP24_HOLLE|nr:Type-1B angiotensin II receptor [Holothuria leucospilota]
MTSTDMAILATTEAFGKEIQKVQDNDVLMKVAFAIIAILGLIGNSLVLAVFYKGRELHVVPNILIGHQSLVDLISSFIFFLNTIHFCTEFKPMTIRQPFLEIFLCKIWFSDYVHWALLHVSTTNLVFVTIERYFAVVHPSKYRTKARKNISLIICISAWFVGFLIEMYKPWIYRISKEDGMCTDALLESGSSERYAIALVSAMTFLIIPAITMAYVYGSIIWTLTSNHFKLSKEIPKGVRDIFTTMIIVSVAYMICWTPDIILYLHHNLVTPHDWTDSVHRIALILAGSNVCVNPIIYIMKFKTFQRGLKQLVTKRPRRVAQQ